MFLKKISQIVALAIIIMSTGSSTETLAQPSMPMPATGSYLVPMGPIPAPNITFFAKDGQSQSLEQYKGRVVLLHYWATYCPPCVAELPEIDRLQSGFAPESFKVIAISTGPENLDVIEEFYKKNQINYLGAFNNSSYMPRAIPVSFLIDRDGNIVASIEGPTAWDAAENLNLIRKYLGQ